MQSETTALTWNRHVTCAPPNTPMEARLYEEVCSLRARNRMLDRLVNGLEREGMDLAAKIDRLTTALRKVTQRWPCSTADDMARVAKEAIGETNV